ncbi:TIGR04222 domain-containing membrane protein [filamentous cyanobacterium LEGE 11480]|uniref:TIGR04222 domain-containing membrane protein n=1 Tax=Romeriopsis navalis LEGE 11480 TaxID=2777977 RepID=A0A928Z564_9CYAN|nr:TIGR04222 domain-containing membrane protein [Romeriopsis navalis]MBE9033331.1 TIGR04222 domain-containing membrane protein [Romeriopsis navalis LEGE 11480]
MNNDILCPDRVLATLTPSQRATYKRLNDYDFDRPDSTLPFSRRLTKENRWSRDYTDRAIREYKRFAFMAVVARHPVSPSDQVDQVWHLHLTYTRSYWQEFCDEILGTPLHHEPTKGGANERAKHDDWYRRTLESYEQIFGHAPPADLWPASEFRFGRDNHFARFNTQQNWILPKPQFLQTKPQLPAVPRLNLRAIVTICLCLGLSSLMVSCQADGSSLNPLDMRGPDFLGFYFCLNMILIGAGLILRQMLRAVAPANSTPRLDDYETAYLAGGRNRLLQAVITKLADQGCVELDAKKQLTLVSPLPRDASRIDSDVATAIDGSTKLHTLQFNADIISTTQQFRDRLIEQGLLLSPAQIQKIKLYPTLLILLSLGLGVMKIFVGMSLGRPVGFLCMIGFVLLIVAVFFYGIDPDRTKAGDRLIAQLTKTSKTQIQLADSAEPNLVNNVALFGSSVLLASGLEGFHSYLAPPVTTSSSSSTTSGCSTSSGSSCSSGCGSSCVSGCGGGCGGCGG